MRFKIFTVLMLLCAVVAVRADDGAPQIKSTDKDALKAAEGKSVTVTGMVSSAGWSKSGKVLNVKFDNDTLFIAAAFSKSRDALDKAFGGDFAKALDGATVKLTGKLVKYGGHDDRLTDAEQLIINTPSQVTIVAAATSQPAETDSASATPTTHPHVDPMMDPHSSLFPK